MRHPDDRTARLERAAPPICAALLAALDLAWNLTHLNIGLADFYGLARFAQGLAQNHAWPATPYFPAGYPLLLAPFGLLGEALHFHGALIGGYLLSVFGMYMLLTATHHLALHWELPRPAALALMLIVLVAPETRVTAGSPTPDLLAGGVALWLLVLAIRAWDGAGQPRDARQAAWLAGLATALRYHMLLVALPLGVIFALRKQTRRFGLLTLAGAVTALAVNHGVYIAQYGKTPASTFMLQVRTGLEMDRAALYPSAEALYADYERFAARGREAALTADYAPREIAAHTLKTWLHFLRRPSCGLALGLCALALLLRRRLEASIPLAALWLILYSLSLSPSYYTPRSALLPCTLGIAISCGIARRLHQDTRWGMAFATLALLMGFALASRFALADCAQRVDSWRLGRLTQDYVRERGLIRRNVAAFSSPLLPLGDNPWCEPFVTLRSSWIADPEIRPEQRPGLLRLDFDAALAGHAPLDAVVTGRTGLQSPQWIDHATPVWTKAREIEQVGEIWEPARQTDADAERGSR